MNIASFWSWDNVNWVSQLLLVVFAGVALISGTIVNRRQAREIASANERALKLEKDAADAKKAQAVAEKSLLELQQLVREPRTIDRKLADEILDWGEKGFGYYFL